MVFSFEPSIPPHARRHPRQVVRFKVFFVVCLGCFLLCLYCAFWVFSILFLGCVFRMLFLVFHTWLENTLTFLGDLQDMTTHKPEPVIPEEPADMSVDETN